MGPACHNCLTNPSTRLEGHVGIEEAMRQMRTQPTLATLNAGMR